MNGALQPVMLKNGEKVQRVPGTAFVYCNTYTGIPASFANLLKNYPGLHEQVVFITIRCAPLLQDVCAVPAHVVALVADKQCAQNCCCLYQGPLTSFRLVLALPCSDRRTGLIVV